MMYAFSMFIFVFVGLLDDPADELSGLFPGTREQEYRDHIEHANCLVEFGILALEVHEPEHQISQNAHQDEHIH